MAQYITPIHKDKVKLPGKLLYHRSESNLQKRKGNTGLERVLELLQG
jgi:hypothetical protein